MLSRLFKSGWFVLFAFVGGMGVVTVLAVVAMALLLTGGSDPENGGPSEAELRQQIDDVKSGALRGEKLQAAVQYALDVQADWNWNHPQHPQWNEHYGELIETTYHALVLRPEQWDSYAGNCVALSMQAARPSFRRREPIEVIFLIGTKLGPGAPFRMRVKPGGFTVMDLKTTIKAFAPGDEIMRDLDGVKGTRIISLKLTTDPAQRGTLADGEHSIGGSAHVSIFQMHGSEELPLAQRDFRLSARYNELRDDGR